MTTMDFILPRFATACRWPLPIFTPRQGPKNALGRADPLGRVEHRPPPAAPRRNDPGGPFSRTTRFLAHRMAAAGLQSPIAPTTAPPREGPPVPSPGARGNPAAEPNRPCRGPVHPAPPPGMLPGSARVSGSLADPLPWGCHRIGFPAAPPRRIVSSYTPSVYRPNRPNRPTAPRCALFRAVRRDGSAAPSSHDNPRFSSGNSMSWDGRDYWDDSAGVSPPAFSLGKSRSTP